MATEAEIRVMQPQVQDGWQPPEWEEAGTGSSPKSLAGRVALPH
jgi:hypothetical protein